MRKKLVGREEKNVGEREKRGRKQNDNQLE
jgi:hypothetical protein